MFLHLNVDPQDHSSCALSYEESEHWIRATWKGYVDPLDAMRGEEEYLQKAAHTPASLLLNDNSQLSGPWFESAEWQAHVWIPQAGRLGLRYVAHVLPIGQQYDMLTLLKPTALPFELQVFGEVAEAQDWLRTCWAAQQRPAPNQ